MSRMGAGHMASQGGGYEPLRSFDFELQLYGVPGQDILKLSVDSFTPSGMSNDPIAVPYLNQVIYVAGQGKASTASVVVRDMVDQDVWGNILQWQKMVQDPDTMDIGLASTYKKQGDLVMLGPDGSGEKHYRMEGIWPTDVKAERVSYKGGDLFNITVTLSVDKCQAQF